MKAKGETRNWAFVGGMIGFAIGGVLAMITLAMYSRGSFAMAPGMDGNSSAAFMAQLGVPLVLVLFGGLGGALIGAGTPRYNAHPQQGRGHHAYHYLKNWRNRPQPRI